MFDYGDRTGYEPISDTDRKEFHEQGFLLLRNVLTEDHRAALEAAVDRVYAEEQARATPRRTAPCTCWASWSATSSSASC